MLKLAALHWNSGDNRVVLLPEVLWVNRFPCLLQFLKLHSLAHGPSSKLAAWHLFFFFLILLHIVVLQNCANFKHKVNQLYMHIYPLLFQIIFPCRLLHSTGSISLCSTVGSCFPSCLRDHIAYSSSLISLCLPFVRTLKAHTDNPGKSLHLKRLNLITN